MIRYLILLSCLLAPLSYADSLLDRLPGLGGGSQQATFLPPDQAFAVEILVRDAHTLQANFKITPSYYLYRDKISFEISDKTAKVSRIDLPQGEMKHDPNFGDIEVYHQSFQAVIALDRPISTATSVTLKAIYQGCSDQGLCYPSIEKQLQIDLPDAQTGVSAPKQTSVRPAPQATAITPLPLNSTTQLVPTNENSKIAQLFKGGNFWLIVSFFFGAGLLLSLTPCVFPMIPILSGIIVGRGHKITKMHAFMLSLAYVLGMAITYAAAGVAAGFSGNLISNALQTPWVLGSFAGVFVLLSLSMFGFYELQLPSAWQSKLSDTSNRLHGGHLSGVFVMGALSAIIMGPCVAAPLAGALLYIGQTHDAVLGGVALFALAIGMGAPLLLIGTSAGVLLPKAGAWMDAVKRFFGVLLLALALWIVQPLLPINVQMFLWAMLLILSAAYLGVLDKLPAQATGGLKIGKGLGLLVLLLGIAYLVGALSGARDLLRPLANLGQGNNVVTNESLQFTRIKNLAELEQRISQAHGQIVMLDFYADWCVSCKEMERYTFADSNVKARLNQAIRLQADVTANSADDKALLQKFSLYGPPGILFFDAKGNEMRDVRVVGYQDNVQFLATLSAAGL